MQDTKVKMGFPPVYDENSRVLILGSFPSVQSRKVSFYYGNKQNRFWRMIYSIFGEEYSEDTEKKKAFLLKNGIALWDIATECQIEGSKDSTLKNAKIADLTPILQTANIQKILLNGALAFQLFETKYNMIGIPYLKMPSTSPANPRFSVEKWKEVLDDLR
ncbi:MAG: DNA-deoxyinosine glycosylase [Clostridia bacterium]|nr:DNA-deoxyinosine glycosylase [Clostridia bacterium]